MWFQGCSRRCHGCFNPETHAFEDRLRISSADLIAQIAAQPHLEGISISGGEPFEQPDELLEFLITFRSAQKQHVIPAHLSVLIFSGRNRADIESLSQGQAVLNLSDVLLAGPYEASIPAPPGSFLSSGNQVLHVLSDRHVSGDFHDLPEAEIIITSSGARIFSGIKPPCERAARHLVPA